nr:hypothetical protein [Pseudonocardia sp. AL041005-10]
MGFLSYSMSMSLDGFVEDPTGSIAFGDPDEEVHRLSNEQTRATSVFLFGRNLYDVMEDFWTAPSGPTATRWRRSSRSSTPRSRGWCSPTR